MAGNSRRQGAVRKSGSKKGATVGSGGQRRRGLEGKGPTPKAEDRPYHVAHKRKKSAEREASRAPAQRSRAPRRSGERTHEIVAGRNAVVEALRAGVPATTVWLASRIEADDRTREILREVTSRGVPLLEVGKPELDKLTEGAVHQGVAMQVPAYSYRQPEDLLDDAHALGRRPLIVALDGVTDPRNLGAALRSAGAFGADGVVVPERRAAGVTASAWKVSAGAAARVPVARATNLVRALKTYQEAGCFIVGLDAGGSVEIGELEVANEALVLVCGSEGKGLSRLVRETCDVIASIPIAASTESLNAGTATGIALYEVARRRRESDR
ncbi:23S rRNA (guanosine(2251)-2'-O)-methyltransferase RlmB [Pseudactinotalea terrae]|uniref:23S rRNA (guanosine(2251)-2'-O)-methyltransferase RlmB n=1 Tax=Pseudactinotalea terrae TaxID=1743262 RepID=UPI0012E2B7BD|nr:23S rRNA (guanosine(2251)-2'-O)-methyltransferase RlmB [Pseudactinotalea terrae]